MAEDQKGPALDIGRVQSFWASLDNRFIEQDSLLRNFKRAELDSTVAAASTGKYAEYWTVDKLADLNNIVDANRNCHPDLKAIFAANATKNPRLRGNRVGLLVFQYVGKLMETGLPATSAPEAVAAPAGGETSSRPQRYVFSPTLPPGCELRVRAAPSMEAESLGVVTAQDEIFAERREGDWIVVRLVDFVGEAWMLVATPEQTLLVPAESSSTPVPPPQVQAPPPQQPVMSAAPTYAPPPAQAFAPQPAASYQAPVQQVFQQQNPLAMSQNLMDTMRPATASTFRLPDSVPYAAYQALEQRVSVLEFQLQKMLAVFRTM